MPARKKPETNNLQKLVHQFEKSISNTIKINLLKGIGEAKVKLEAATQGATDALIRRAIVSIDLFAKIDISKTHKEYRGYNILKETPLSPHLIPPLCEERNDYWLAPFLDNATDLYAVTQNSIGWANKIHNNFLKMMRELWDGTKTEEEKEKCKKAYQERFLERYNEILRLGFHPNTSIIVNTTDITSLEKLKDEFLDRLNILQIPFSVTAHRDEHPKNILVPTAEIGSNESVWYLIDYVNAEKRADWVFSVAKMLQGWWPYYPIELYKGNKLDLSGPWGNYVDPRNKKKLEINFDKESFERYVNNIMSDHHIEEVKKMNLNILKFAARFASSNNDNLWSDRLRLALFLVIFGSLPFHIRSQNKLSHTVPLLLSQALNIWDATTPIQDFCAH